MVGNVQEELAEKAVADKNYVGVDPELPCVDRFICGTIDSLESADEEVHAFVRAGLFRSFTARKVSLVLLQQTCLYTILRVSPQRAALCSYHLPPRFTISQLLGMCHRMAGQSPPGRSWGILAQPSCRPAVAQTFQQFHLRQLQHLDLLQRVQSRRPWSIMPQQHPCLLHT